MPTYTPAAQAPPTSYTLPADGEKVKAASVNPTFEDLADAVKWLTESNMPSTPIAYWHRNDWEVADNTWTYGFTPHWGPSQLTTGGQIGLALDLPHGCTLNTVTVYIDPAAGHGGLPTLPNVKVYKTAPDVGTQTQLGSTSTDTSGSVGAYEAIHAMPTISSINEVIDREALRYYLVFTGEAGGNFVALLRITGVQVQYTVTKRDDGAA
jgi:hypothetical protein